MAAGRLGLSIANGPDGWTESIMLEFGWSSQERRLKIKGEKHQ